MTARRKRLKLNGAQLNRLGAFLMYCGGAQQLGAEGRRCYEEARTEWRLMDSVARAAVIRLGLRPQLTHAGLIPE